jgi:threonine dehydratase
MTASIVTPATEWPITLADIERARDRISTYLSPTPLRHYRQLGALVGAGIDVFVKHENHQPTNSFKIRNGLSFMTSLSDDERRRGVVAASTGNHGQGIAYGGSLLAVDTVVCVPVGNNPEKNAAIRALGATVVEEGRDYDEAIGVMERIAARDGRLVAHSTNDRRMLAGAGTITLEILEQEPELDAIVIAVGGGSQAVGALTVARAFSPNVAVYGVQAAGAAAVHDSWHARQRCTTPRADTFAEGIATRSTCDLTFAAMLAGLADFVTVSDAEIAEAIRVLLSVTHNLVEGAGAVGYAALGKLRDTLAGQRVAVIFSGGNLDLATLRRIVTHEL